VSELRGLRNNLAGFEGIRLVAISAAPPEEKFGFPILLDPDLSVAKKLGMLHSGAAPDGADAARPGTYVLDRDGRVRRLFLGSQLRARPDPAEVIAAAKAAR
jgi:peroxiredoxin